MSENNSDNEVNFYSNNDKNTNLNYNAVNKAVKKSKIIVITAVITFVICVLIFTGLFVAWTFTYKLANLDQKNISEISKNVSPNLIKKFAKMNSIILDKYYKKLDQDKVFEGSISGIVNSLPDPYSNYFNPKEMKEFIETSSGSYVGIGILIEPQELNVLKVIEIFEDSPAKAAGLAIGDLITKVNGKDVSRMKDADEVISKIKGIEGTKVRINIYRTREKKEILLDIKRKTIKVKNSESKMIEDVGYIRIIHFDEEVITYFINHLDDILSKGAKGLILDLRNNPGGAYDQVVSIADRLLPKGVIVYTKDQKGKIEKEFSDDIEIEIPIAVLINESSASASEILAGAIKDYKKGVLIGKKTYGKGLVQEFFDLEDGSGMKITISEYFTPKGIAINTIGIKPDIEVDIPKEYEYVSVSSIPMKSDTQLQAAIKYLKERLGK